MSADERPIEAPDRPAEGAPVFDLFSRSGGGVVFMLTDEGVAVEPDALAVRRAGRWTRVPFAEIDGVTLSTGSGGRSSMGQCTILLRNLTRLTVVNANVMGVADGKRDTTYREFVRAFHRALVAGGGAGRISFRSGFSEARANGLMVMVVVAGIFCIVLPLVLAVATHEFKGLLLLLGGVGFVAPLWRVATTNRPRTYNPAQPPDLLP